MNIAIIGSGGRESALAWKVIQSPLCDHLYILPGNGGTSSFGKNMEIDISNLEALKSFILDEAIEMLIVGPEAPLVDGIYDKIKKDIALKDLLVIGPSKTGAMLEGSKAYAKIFMEEFGIPTASYGRFGADQVDNAIAYLKEQSAPYVLKADGLAAGKGVIILNSEKEAIEEVKSMLSGKFGEASSTIVIEEFLSGIEFSVFVLTDGKDYKILPVAKDYKRRGEGDTGLNTGGMGAVSPVPFVDKNLMDKVEKDIIQPTIHGIQSRSIDYQGFIFFGLIKVGDNPFVIEYNCRMGDPETEVVVPRITSDLVELLASLGNDTLSEKQITFDTRTAATIMMVSEGYPGTYNSGKKITGLEKVTDSLVFQAGTKKTNEELFSNGGRVLAVTSLSDNMEKALNISKKNIKKIHFEGMQFRSDIGFDL